MTAGRRHRAPLPRTEATSSVLESTESAVRVTPSPQSVDTEAGRPSDSRAVSGVPSASRKSGQLPDEKPSACITSCTAVARCAAKSSEAAEREEGQKLA